MRGSLEVSDWVHGTGRGWNGWDRNGVKDWGVGTKSVSRGGCRQRTQHQQLCGSDQSGKGETLGEEEVSEAVIG